ncbi:MAG: pyruvate formate-lyase [Lachnospiraceae bacterium]|nr:pyruvate formate-lyase [Lachnospiraceae bacterium]
MNSRLKDYIVNKKHHAFRRDCTGYTDLAERFAKEQLPAKERMTRRFELAASLEEPVLLPEEQICFMRTVKKLPDCFTQDEWDEIKKHHFIHELGYMSNLSPNYERVIAGGLLAEREKADEYGVRIIDAMLDLTERYRRKAMEEGREDIAQVLARVPAYGATNFREALQSFRIIHYSLWLEGDYHVTTGRFDKYMYPYLKADMDRGLYTRESALELLEDFFLSFNKDSDLYPGVQQGDNGQSMVLGGIDENGRPVFNLLSELCLEASRHLMMIDPKINLRVDKNTPLRIYELGSELTKAGLGFPQYSNDDVVIKGLEKLGYEHKDACDYVVAACWEFIIPKVGADVANIAALSFPKVVDVCLHRDLESCDTFEAFMDCIREEIGRECDEICGGIRDLWFVPSPLMNIMIDGGVYDGAKYNNFGIHGTGIATAADSLAVISKYVYDEKRFDAKTLIEAVDSDFAEHAELLPLLRNEAPKMGNNEDLPDGLGVDLLGSFAASLKGRKNCRGGIYRAGTGTAMYYLWHADQIGASPDGRRAGEPFGTNFSASLFARINGPLSVVRSFTKPDFTDSINGGPLTMEFAASMFRDPDSVSKVAALVKAFIDMGGHQMQLNAVNSELLRDAQIHPEEHRQLVVRIWGWSAYFVELDRAYQDHVLARQQYVV